MVDTAFDDFLDSDDDEFFREASSHFLDCDIPPESSKIADKNDAPTHSSLQIKNESVNTNLSTETNKNNSDTALAEYKLIKDNLISPELDLEFKSDDFSDYDETCSNESKTSHKSVVIECVTSSKAQSDTSLQSSAVHMKEFASSVKLSFSESANCDNKLPVNKCKNTVNSIETKSESDIQFYSPVISSNKNSLVTASSSVTCNSSSSSNLNKSSGTPASSYINNRFTPGFTPKAKRRKLPGPAGLLEMFDGSKETGGTSSQNMSSMDIGFENIVSSQFTPEHLLLSSWQKLQAAVSSCSNLHSTVKYYSIQSVLQESSKKKLPKHMIVPILCVLLKKPNIKGSSTISVFMDDTGEINGKIDVEVISTYKHYLVEGTALILKNITFLCNVLILKAQNIVSMYHPDGTEKHTQSLESVLETPEPLNPMNCECFKLPNQRWKNNHNISHYNDKDYHKPSCISHNQNKFNSLNPNKFVPKFSPNKIPVKDKLSCVNFSQKGLNTVSDQNRTVNKSLINLNSGKDSKGDETSNPSKTMRSDEFLENLLDEDNGMDDFDALIGNLDEESFMEGI